jgi:hypothetical protein
MAIIIVAAIMVIKAEKLRKLVFIMPIVYGAEGVLSSLRGRIKAWPCPNRPGVWP